MSTVPTQASRRGLAGGLAIGRIQREAALKRYYADPVICLTCDQPIPVRDGERVSDVKCRKFCDKSCAARTNNRYTPKRRSKLPRRNCIACGDTLNRRARLERCLPCDSLNRLHLRGMMTKAEVGRTSIAAHARLVTREWEQRCAVCGYSRHVDAAHLVPVRDFAADALLSEINAPTNLALLCPNHHWEHDHGGID